MALHPDPIIHCLTEIFAHVLNYLHPAGGDPAAWLGRWAGGAPTAACPERFTAALLAARPSYPCVFEVVPTYAHLFRGLDDGEMERLLAALPDGEDETALEAVMVRATGVPVPALPAVGSLAPGAAVLELPGSYGYLSRQLCQRQPGLDIRNNFRLLCRNYKINVEDIVAYTLTGINALLAGAGAGPLPGLRVGRTFTGPERFDLVLAAATWQEQMGELRQLLKPGGRVILTPVEPLRFRFPD